MTLLQLDKIAKSYSQESAALEEMSLWVKIGTRLGIVGETGSGKSTLLRLAAGLEQPDAGSVLFEGVKVKGPNDKLIPGHPEIAYLSQYSELPKFITVAQHLNNEFYITQEEASKINEACQVVHLLEKDTSELSGGEKQRVALAKILTNFPRMLLLDEPFSNLDLEHKLVIKEAIDAIEREWETTVVLVSHDPQDMLPWADEVVVLKAGKVMQQDTPKVVYNQPGNEYVAGLFGRYNLLSSSLEKKFKNIDQLPRLGRNAFVRPEQLMISSESQSGAQGKVQKVLFNGSYDELLIKLGRSQLIGRSEVGAFQAGDHVFVSLKGNLS